MVFTLQFIFNMFKSSYILAKEVFTIYTQLQMKVQELDRKIHSLYEKLRTLPDESWSVHTMAITTNGITAMGTKKSTFPKAIERLPNN